MKTNWKYKPELAQVTGIDNGNCEVIVAKVFGHDSEEVDEHARLIAKAPASYDLVEHILAMADDSYLDGHPEWVEIVREAKAIHDSIEGA